MSSLFRLKETQFDSFTLDSAKTRIRNSKCMKKLNSLISKEIFNMIYIIIILYSMLAKILQLTIFARSTIFKCSPHFLTRLIILKSFLIQQLTSN